MTADPLAQVQADERAARKQVGAHHPSPAIQGIIDSPPMMPSPSFLKLQKGNGNDR